MEKFVTNTFNKGWLADITPDKFPKEAYLELINGRIISKDPLRTGSVTNAKGNSEFFQIPNVPPIFKLSPIVPITGTQHTFRIHVVITDINLNPLVFDSGAVTFNSSSTEELSSIVSQFIEDNNPSSGVVLYCDNDGEDILFSVDSGLTVSISIVDANYNPVYGASQVAPAINAGVCRIVGWSVLRDSLILFTTSNDVDGQIWKVDYNPSTLVTSYSLKYYNAGAGFSTSHPIINEAKALYETTNIQRVYWTDNFNPPRKLNLANKSSFFTSPQQLSNTTVVSFRKPVITEILTGGNLDRGVYQIGYILKSSVSSNKTAISPLSGEVNIVWPAEDGNARYWGSGSADPLEYSGGAGSLGNATKAIKGKVTNLDNSDFDLVDFVVFYRDDYNTIRKYYFDRDIPVPDDGTVNFTCSELDEPFTDEEVKLRSQNIIRVKTIDVKDNTLFYGNVKLSGNSELRFNARAYRYLVSSASTYVGDDAADEGDANWNVDAINPYNTFGIEVDSVQNGNWYKYKKNSSILGGTGPNVEYEFTVEELYGDKTGMPTTWPFIDVDRSSTVLDLGVDDDKYNNQNFFHDYKSPYINLALRGYMPGEVYRFGLLLYDLVGNPAYINWIGDVKFPEMQELYTMGDSSYNLIQSDGSRIKTLGIKFRVSVPGSVASQISGYKIVRVNRSEEDMTRVDTGILSTMRKVGWEHWAWNIGTGWNQTDDREFYCFMYDFHNNAAASVETYGQGLQFVEYNIFSFLPQSIYSFDSPLVQFGNASPFKAGDKLRVEFRLTPNSIPITSWIPVGALSTGQIYKYYLSGYLSPEYYDVTQFSFLGEQGKATINGLDAVNLVLYPGSSIFYNVAFQSDSLPRSVYRAHISVGCRTSVFDVSGNLSILFSGVTEKLLTTLCRPMTNQYGGANQTARENNVYIGCCNFVSVDDMPTGLFSVWGGDTYVGIQDSVKGDIASLVPGGGGSAFSGFVQNTVDPQNDRRLVSWFYPVVGRYNTLLRTGEHFANKVASSLYNTSRVFEDFWFHGSDPGTYSNVDNIYSYNPVPSVVDFAEEFDNKIMSSASKITGERFDSWSIFDGTNILVDGIHGPINKIITHHDDLYFFQDKAYGRVRVHPRTAVPTMGSGDDYLTTQTGGVLDSFDYISIKRGTKHQFSVFGSSGALYFADVINKRLVKFDDQNGTRDISDIDGIKSYLSVLSGNVETTDTILSGIGIHGILDAGYNSALYTILGSGGNTTVGYNEMINAWENSFSFTPAFYMHDGRNLFSVRGSDLTRVWIHDKGDYGSFYGTVYSTTVSIIANPDYDVSKIFDTFQYESEFLDTFNADKYDETFTSVRVRNDYQDSGWTSLIFGNNIRRRLRTWHLLVPRDNREVGVPARRTRGHYAIASFRYDNVNNRRFYLGNITTSYRPMPI